MKEEPDVEGQIIDPTIAEKQIEKLSILRQNRDGAKSQAALSALTVAAATDENLFPFILTAVKAKCSVGEIMNAMKVEFGTWMAPSGF